MRVRVFTVGHGARPAAELVDVLRAARVATVVDVRRYPGSRRHPQFGQAAIEAALGEAEIGYRHEVELGGRRSGESGEERFACLRNPAFRSYAARMAHPAWREALDRALAAPAPCLMCAETLWWRCHRRLIADLLTAGGHEVLHLLRSGETQRHRLAETSEARDGMLFVCGEPVAGPGTSDRLFSFN
jgi:uncharacterized protein (DUF488 family)